MSPPTTRSRVEVAAEVLDAQVIRLSRRTVTKKGQKRLPAEDARRYEAAKRAYGLACHAITCSYCRYNKHLDECWERRLILGEM